RACCLRYPPTARGNQVSRVMAPCAICWNRHFPRSELRAMEKRLFWLPPAQFLLRQVESTLAGWVEVRRLLCFSSYTLLWSAGLGAGNSVIKESSFNSTLEGTNAGEVNADSGPGCHRL